MGQEEYKRTWQQYNNAFAEALIAPGADNPDSPAGQRMVGAAAWPHLRSMRAAGKHSRQTALAAGLWRLPAPQHLVQAWPSPRRPCRDRRCRSTHISV